jgi:hypothetical protein
MGTVWTKKQYQRRGLRSLPFFHWKASIKLGKRGRPLNLAAVYQITGIGIWAAQQALKQSGTHHGWLFRWGDGYKESNKGSLAVNTFLKNLMGGEKRSHSFRHACESRLTHAEVPQGQIDQILGHASLTKSRIASGYFGGYPMQTLRDAMEKIAIPAPAGRRPSLRALSL